MKNEIDYLLVKALFDYNRSTGILTHKLARPGVIQGKEAGAIDKSGVRYSIRLYRRVRLFGQVAYTHRVIWVWVTGLQPDEVDHIDGDGLNNKWENLRNVSHLKNARNQKIYTTNTSGTAGVTKKDNGRWRARIMVDGKMMDLGTFIKKQDAINARKQFKTVI